MSPRDRRAACRARHGSAPYAVVDANVDLAAEYGLNDAALRRAVDRRWMVGAADAELEELLKDDDTPTETVTLAQALAELPRLLDPGARRRSGAYRSLEITNSGQTPSDRTAPVTERSRPSITDDQAAEILDPHGPPGSAT